MEFDASDNVKLQVNVLTRGLAHPWALAFLPNGDILVTERSAGRVRIIRKGVLDPTPVATLQVANSFRLSGLMDIALHPSFAQNNLVYLTYNKPRQGSGGIVTLARGRWDGSKLVDIKDILVTDTLIGAARIAFGKDGYLYMVVGGPPGPGSRMNAGDVAESQDPSKHMGKVLRLRDDGTAAPGNPFSGAGARPEVYTLGQRNALGLALNPFTDEIWETENGPQGGDEVNVIRAGKNYGWPVVSYGRWYEGPRVVDNPYKEGMEMPLVYWVPAIATSGMTFYTNDKVPQWRRNLFVGAMEQGRTLFTGHIQRIVFNAQWEEIKREPMLTSLKQRIREVREGPEGSLYVLTDEDEGVLLRIDPTDVTPRPAANAPGRTTP